ncbi:MAG: NeuD/PglB/VioB family sugar acetyltransferase [Acidobacteriota bacterium]|nr:NeuD/PglB/VioB family sugar acetyltransferase [Acidobacteriota bacterium]
MIAGSIVLLGAGGHGRACVDVVEQQGGFTVAGFVGVPAEVGTQVFGYAVLGTDEEMPALVDRFGQALVTVGQVKTPEPRRSLFDRWVSLGGRTPVIVSPRAYVSRHATVGAGTIVMHGAVVNAGAVIGRNCIINSQALVEHDTIIADHCHVATAAAINSGVTIGVGTFIGSQASVRQGLTIGEACVIGMGQRVLADCENGTRLPSVRRSS